MTQGLMFSSGTSTTTLRGGGTSTGAPQTERQKGSVGVTLTCHFARMLLSRPVAQRAFFRAQIVNLLRKSREPERCIDALLQVCIAEGGSDGLDVAIDVLAKLDGLILEYAWDYVRRAVSNWNPSSERAYQPNDDYWYVLLRAVGRADAPEKARFRFISCCANAESRGIREGVVEALRDLATPGARDRLRRFAEEDQDAFVREVAREALADLES